MFDLQIFSRRDTRRISHRIQVSPNGLVGSIVYHGQMAASTPIPTGLTLPYLVNQAREHSPAVAASPEVAAVHLEIEPADISEMEYFCNESPMADPASNNAIASALRRHIRPGNRIGVFVTDTGRARALIGRRKCDLGDRLGAWLKLAVTGWRCEPITQTVMLPRDILLPTPNRRRA